MAQIANTILNCVGAPAVTPVSDTCDTPAIIYESGELALISQPYELSFTRYYTQVPGFVINCTSGQNEAPCYGISYGQATVIADPGFPDYDAFNYYTVWHTQNLHIPLSSVVGTPRVGIGVNVRNDSTAFDTRCYGLIADFADNTIKFVFWNNESLEDYGTILGSISMDDVTIDDKVYLNHFQYGGSGWFARQGNPEWPDKLFIRNNSIGLGEVLAPTNLADLNHEGMGIIVVGVSGAPILHSCDLILPDGTEEFKAITVERMEPLP